MATKPSSKPNTLTIEHLSYSYQNGDRTQIILNDISAEFKSGKVYAIVGESGSGKTTFLSLISALDKLQSGDIKYNNKSLREITGQEFRLKYVNIVFQSYNLIKYMTAAENIEVASDFDGREIDPTKYLEKVGLTAEEGKRLLRPTTTRRHRPRPRLQLAYHHGRRANRQPRRRHRSQNHRPLPRPCTQRPQNRHHRHPLPPCRRPR